MLGKLRTKSYTGNLYDSTETYYDDLAFLKIKLKRLESVYISECVCVFVFLLQVEV